jgi:hypothetical protein
MEKLGRYIINIVKSVGKDKDYAINIVEWYTQTEKQDKEVKEYINNNF